MIAWLVPVVAVVGALLEACAVPRAFAAPRLSRAMVSGGFAVALAFVILMITARPLSSAVATFALMAIVVVVSNAKFRAIREPLVFVDFAMLGQIVRHPHIFITFVGVLATIVGSAALAAAIAAATLLEDPLPGLLGQRPGARLAGVLAVLLVIAVIVRLAHRRLAGWCWALQPSLNPQADIERFGLFGALLLTTVLAIDGAKAEAARPPMLPAAVGLRSTNLPNIVAVQLESFFDVRLMDPRFDPGLLPCFDAYAGSAALRGRLDVPAWGYTQRSEFAFLSGLAEQDLGIDRYNPYARFARRPVWTIAHELRALGYRTVCIHPFYGTFFGRDRVVSNLGFDRFLDISAFAGAPRFGPYVSDQAVAERAIALLEEPGAPLFIFIITIESHGAWRNNRLPPEELAALRNGALDLPPAFLCYLRHLGNADRMIGQLAGHFERSGEGVLCVYGDHLPSFPGVFRKMRFGDGRTDYLIWRPDHDGPVAVRDMHVRSLSGSLMEVARFPRRAARRSVGT
jgi:phosphoglycerol transferase MdoB-like AlkP superfamily enzyme